MAVAMISSLTVPASIHAESHLSILYLGSTSGTSGHRAQALARLGHKVQVVDPCGLRPSGRVSDYWVHHTGAWGLGRLVRNRVLDAIGAAEFDLVWVDAGGLVSPSLIHDLKQRAGRVINYNVDDPYGRRDGKKWRLYLRSIPRYDLVAVVRDCNVAEAYRAGAKDVIRVHRSSDDVAHAPRETSPDDRAKWNTEIAFVGTWMPERGPFLATLVERGVPLTIWGDRWPKAREWPILRPLWRGPNLENPDEYAMAVQSAKVCIGLLSKGNRDLCTQRSFEIPRLGSVLCAERTPEHLALYEEDVEAVFWNSPEECAEKCQRLLKDEEWRSKVARNGQRRALQNRTSNESVMNQIIYRAFSLAPAEELVS